MWCCYKNVNRYTYIRLRILDFFKISDFVLLPVFLLQSFPGESKMSEVSKCQTYRGSSHALHPGFLHQFPPDGLVRLVRTAGHDPQIPGSWLWWRSSPSNPPLHSVRWTAHHSRIGRAPKRKGWSCYYLFWRAMLALGRKWGIFG